MHFALEHIFSVFMKKSFSIRQGKGKSICVLYMMALNFTKLMVYVLVYEYIHMYAVSGELRVRLYYTNAISTIVYDFYSSVHHDQ